MDNYSNSPLLRRPIFPTMQNRTQSTNPWFNQVYPTGCSVGQANLDEPWPRQNVSPGLHFFPSLLFSGSFVQCAQLFLQFLTFPITGRSITIAVYHCSDSPLFRRPIIPTTHYSDSPLFRQPITDTLL
jgi:hypothetical protein